MLDLTNKTVAEKSDLKASAIVTLTPKGKFTSGDIQVEIIAVSKIKEGVELFAKAWRGKDQIGFGADGSVDIERFRFFNPPVMVSDGTKKVTTLNEAPFAGVRMETDNFKYDPLEALKSSLLHVIQLVGKSGTRIKAGRIGATTDTFYPAAGANSPVDGLMYNAGAASWGSLKARTTSDFVYVTTNAGIVVHGSKDGATWTLVRSAFCFNTSTIGSGKTISAATFSLYSQAAGTESETTYPANLAVVSVALTSTSNIQSSDFTEAQWGTVRFATDVLLSTFNASAQYHNFSLNASGIANINTGGVSQFGIRAANDLDNNAPSALSTGQGYFADWSGTTNDPKLVVTYSVASSPQLIMVSQ